MSEQEIRLRELLRQTAEQLERWANEARTGGWSTQHVTPMREQAARIYEALGRRPTP